MNYLYKKICKWNRLNIEKSEKGSFVNPQKTELVNQ